MSDLNPAALMGLLAADPAARQAQVQELLLQHMGGGAPGAAAFAPSQVMRADAAVTPPEQNTGTSLQRVISEATALNTELERVSALLDTVALALGACTRCLGTDTACRCCAGAGTPGSTTPNVDRFEQVVAPAARRLVSDVEGHRSPTKEPV